MLTALIIALASFVLMGILVMVVPTRHENRVLACLIINGLLCLYLFTQACLT